MNDMDELMVGIIKRYREIFARRKELAESEERGEFIADDWADTDDQLIELLEEIIAFWERRKGLPELKDYKGSRPSST